MDHALSIQFLARLRTMPHLSRSSSLALPFLFRNFYYILSRCWRIIKSGERYDVDESFCTGNIVIRFCFENSIFLSERNDS